MDQITQLERTLRYAKNNLEKGVIYSNIAVLWDKIGNVQNALENHRNALRFSKKSETQCLVSYRFLSECYRKLKKFQKSCDYSEKHLTLAIKLGDKLEIQRGYCNKGNIYLDFSEKVLEKDKEEEFLRNIQIAHDSFTKSLKICEALIQDFSNPNNHSSTNSEDREQIIMKCKKLFNEAQFNVGNCFFVWGKLDPKYYKDALESLKKAANYAKSLKSHILEGKAYSTIALLHFNKEEYTEAETYWKKDAQICEANRDYQGWTLTLRNIARVYHARRQYQQSIEHFEKAKEVCRKYLESNDWDEINEEISEVESERKLKKEIDEKIKKFDQMERKKDYSTEYLLLGKDIIEKLCDRLLDYERAYPLAKQYMSVLKSMLDEEDVLTGSSLTLVTKTYSYLGIIGHNLKKCEESKNYFKEAMKVLEKNDRDYKQNGDYLALLIDLGNVMDDAGDTIQAMADVYWRAFELGRKADLMNIIRSSLNNLEFIYQKGKDNVSLQKVKELKNELIESQDPPAHEESDDNDFDDGGDDFEEEDEEEKNEEREILKREEKQDRRERSVYEGEMEIEYTKPKKSDKKNDRMDIIYDSIPDEEEDLFPKESFYRMHCPRTNSFSNEGNSNRSNKENKNKNKPVIKKSDFLEDSFLSAKTSKRQKTFILDELEKDAKEKSTAVQRYNQYIKKHGFDEIQEIKSQLGGGNTMFDVNNQFLPDWAIIPAIKALKFQTYLQELNLKNNRVSFDCIQLFIKYIPQDSPFLNLKKLSLAYNPIDTQPPGNQESFKIFLDLLFNKLSLEYLDLSAIEMENEISKHFFKALDQNTSLMTLKLKACNLESIFPEYKSNYTLQSLCITENSFDSSSIKVLLCNDKFPSLRNLKVSNQDFSPKLHIPEPFSDLSMIIEEHSRMEVLSEAPSQLKHLRINTLDSGILSKLTKEIKFENMLENLQFLDISDIEKIDLIFEGMYENFISSRMAGISPSLKITVLKANRITFSEVEKISTLFKFISLLSLLQEAELQEINLREDDVGKLCETLNNFCTEITSINLTGSLTHFSQALMIKRSVPSLNMCLSDL